VHTMNSRYITNQIIDDINSVTLDFDVLELIAELDAEINDSDFSLVPIYDEQGFFYSYDV
jgi:hypothetical protein